jgi:hypothetical protein
MGGRTGQLKVADRASAVVFSFSGTEVIPGAAIARQPGLGSQRAASAERQGYPHSRAE